MRSGVTPVVVALDVGTSSVRALLYDRRGRSLPGAEVHLPYRPHLAADGTAEVDAERLLALVETALDRVLRGGRHEVLGVGISTFWHGLLGIDARGRPATPLWLWSDSRSWRQAESLKRRLDAPAIHRRTGCPLHPSYWPAKLAWAGPRAAARWTSFADFLCLRLFGEWGTSLSMASGTGLCSLRGRAWDGPLYEALSVKGSQLPPLVSAPYQGLRPSYARRWPALARVPWAPAAGDGALANLGSGCTTPKLRALTIGTSGALRVITEALPRRLPRELWCYRLDAERLVLGGSFSNGGNLYAWMLQNLRLDAAGLERRLARMPPAATGLTFLPLLAGERSPHFAAHATGAIAGLTLSTSALDIARAGLEAIALDFARVDHSLDQVAPGGEVLVGSGAGLLASPAWMQILADAVGKPLVAGHAREASSRGAALLALEILGRAPKGHEHQARRGRTFMPRTEAHRAYQVARRSQERLYRQVLVQGGSAKG
ncbi:MAG TPA: gluconokinase [Candidatus Dormibacteraeota bacterium]